MCNPFIVFAAPVYLCLSCSQGAQIAHGGLSSAEPRERTAYISLLAIATQDVGKFCCTGWVQLVFHDDLQVFYHATFHSDAPLCAWVLGVIPPQVKDFCTPLALKSITTF